MGVRFAQETGRACGTVVEGVPDVGVDDLDHRPNERSRRVVLTTVAARVAHAVDLVLVQRRHLVHVLVRAELEAVGEVDDFAEGVAALDAEGQLVEDFTNFVLNGVGGCSASFERLQVRPEAVLDELVQVVAGQRRRVVQHAILLRGGPCAPTVFFGENARVAAAGEDGFSFALRFERVEVLQKEQPRGLLDVVELGGAPCVLAQFVVDALEDVAAHGLQMWPPYITATLTTVSQADRIMPTSA